VMDEYVLAILTADEAKTLGVVKPLHCSLFHFLFYLCFCMFRLFLLRSFAPESG
jgi:hypothetical protein